MKIVMIGQKGLPAHIGGVERAVDELATRLVAQGHEVVAYCRKNYTLNANFVQDYKGITLVYLPTIRSKYFEMVIHVFLSTIHSLFQKADVIHYHGIGPSIFAWIPRIFSPRSKVYATFQCKDYYHAKWGPISRVVFRIGEYVACTMTHKTIVVSKLLQRYVASRYGRKAIYIPNGVTIPHRRPIKKIVRYGLTHKGYILSVSRLVRHKGIHYLIDAYQALKGLGVTLPTLVIVGESSFTDGYVKELKEKAKGDKDILFLGAKQGDTLAELFSNTALFIQSSEQEGLSLALLEAMSYGAPVLVSDIAENKEVVPWVGASFHNKNVKDLTHKLEHFFATPTHATLEAKKNRAHVKVNYNFDHLVGETVQAYSAV
ncbi:MAG: glycosyltransferase family 4 protein [bacterium]|nr:glycosyltransferase family 4 protein [bacterium]